MESEATPGGSAEKGESQELAVFETEATELEKLFAEDFEWKDKPPDERRFHDPREEYYAYVEEIPLARLSKRWLSLGFSKELRDLQRNVYSKPKWERDFEREEIQVNREMAQLDIFDPRRVEDINRRHAKRLLHRLNRHDAHIEAGVTVKTRWENSKIIIEREVPMNESERERAEEVSDRLFNKWRAVSGQAKESVRVTDDTSETILSQLRRVVRENRENTNGTVSVTESLQGRELEGEIVEP